jgi:hypothetical protein
MDSSVESWRQMQWDVGGCRDAYRIRRSSVRNHPGSGEWDREPTSQPNRLDLV